MKILIEKSLEWIVGMSFVDCGSGFVDYESPLILLNTEKIEQSGHNVNRQHIYKFIDKYMYMRKQIDYQITH